MSKNGLIASSIALTTVYPIDVIRTNKQLKEHYTIYQTINSIYKKKGIVSFYNGLLYPLLFKGIKKGYHFYIFERYKNNPIFAGFAAGSTASIVNTPLHSTMIKLQSQKLKSSHDIFKNNEFSKTFKTLPYQCCRDSIFGMIYFGSYGHFINNYPNITTYQSIILGGSIGAITWVVGYPLDTLLVRKQYNIETKLNFTNNIYSGMSLILTRAIVANMITIGVYHYLSKL